MVTIISLFIFSYVSGSINFSILLFKLLGKGDPRGKFSKNAGATNVYRQAGIYWAIVVLVFDMSRAVGVALVSLHVLPHDFVPLMSFGLILGNRFPCFHEFKGGKGVANYLGFTTALAPITALISGFAWLVFYAFLRVPFISSFLMIFILAAGTIISYSSKPLAVAGTCVTSIFIFISHRQNIVEWLKSSDTT
ncbi:MAG: glycerol-3-phosphate acyltransferase [Desulfobacterales bacterium]|nr:glycerol-3-phosphate acyltransferase [Desulfobacterales bacterium]